MATDVDLTVEDGIAWLTMRRPGSRNAVEAAFMEAAIDTLDKLPDGVGALVLAGEGPAFCVGVDLQMTRDAISNGQIEEKLVRLLPQNCPVGLRRAGRRANRLQRGAGFGFQRPEQRRTVHHLP